MKGSEGGYVQISAGITAKILTGTRMDEQFCRGMGGRPICVNVKGGEILWILSFQNEKSY